MSDYGTIPTPPEEGGGAPPVIETDSPVPSPTQDLAATGYDPMLTVAVGLGAIGVGIMALLERKRRLSR